MLPNRIDIMVDLETLSLKSDCNIIQIAAVAFDITSGTILDRFDVKCKIDPDRYTDHNTVEWWLNTNRELFKEILSSATTEQDESLQQFVDWFKSKCVIFPQVNLWGNGILFDNCKLLNACEHYDLEYPVNYKYDRDMRTLVEMACDKSGKTRDELNDMFPTDTTQEHNALYDCEYQVQLVSWCWRTLMYTL